MIKWNENIEDLVTEINQCDPPGWHGPETVVESIEFFPAVPGEADAILRVYYRWRHVDINLRYYPKLRAMVQYQIHQNQRGEMT